VNREDYNAEVQRVRRVLQNARLFRELRIPYTTSNPALIAVAKARSHYGQAMQYMDSTLASYDEHEAVEHLKAAATKCNEALDGDGLSEATRERAENMRMAFNNAIAGLENAWNAYQDAMRQNREAKEKNFPRNLKRRERFSNHARIVASAADILDYFGITHEITFSTSLRELALPLLTVAEVASPQGVADKLAEAGKMASEGKLMPLWRALYEIENELEARNQMSPTA
jgi:hypothetical protein